MSSHCLYFSTLFRHSIYLRHVPYYVAQITPVLTHDLSLIFIKQTTKLRPSRRHSVVGVSTSYGLDGPGTAGGGTDNLFSKTTQPCPGAHSGHRGYFPEVVRPGRLADHSLRSIAKVKNEWNYTSTLPTCLNRMDRNSLIIFTFKKFRPKSLVIPRILSLC